ncbi:MAG: flagellar basal body rod protein FlgB [Nitrospirae bacterium]|nr:flagellar basal body rod protein FlgB [Candidatus Troglogloeales bacterium]
MFINLFDKTTNLLHRALDLRAAKHQATTSNIANQDTPFYKAKEMDFRKAIRDFIPPPVDVPMSTTNKSHFSLMVKLAQTDPQHIPVGGNPRGAESYVEESQDRTTRPDQNNVNAEQELARMAENQLMFNAASQMIAGRFAGLKSAIREGR